MGREGKEKRKRKRRKGWKGEGGKNLFYMPTKKTLKIIVLAETRAIKKSKI